MLVRTHRNGDIPYISRLYYDTIHLVNCNDYSREQIEAWAPAVPEDSFWKVRFKNYNVYVAEEDGHIVGFTELDSVGHIDCFSARHFTAGPGSSTARRCYGAAGGPRPGTDRSTPRSTGRTGCSTRAPAAPCAPQRPSPRRSTRG